MSALLRHPSTWLAASSLAALALLLSGNAPLLETRLAGGLPVGNLVTVVALLGGALAGFYYSRRGSLLRLLSITAAMAAVGWLPMCVATSGNLAASFRGDDAGFALWFRYTAVAAILTLATLLTTLGIALVDSRRATRD